MVTSFPLRRPAQTAAVLEQELPREGHSPESIARVISKLADAISSLRSECDLIRSSLDPAREAFGLASAKLAKNAEKREAEAAAEADSIVKHQQLSLAREARNAGQSLGRTSRQWEQAAKKLAQYCKFLRQEESVLRELSAGAALIPLTGLDDEDRTVAPAQAIARAVGARFTDLRPLKDGLTHFKSALAILGYAAEADPRAPSSAPTSGVSPSPAASAPPPPQPNANTPGAALPVPSTPSGEGSSLGELFHVRPSGRDPIGPGTGTVDLRPPRVSAPAAGNRAMVQAELLVARVRNFRANFNAGGRVPSAWLFDDYAWHLHEAALRLRRTIEARRELAEVSREPGRRSPQLGTSSARSPRLSLVNTGFLHGDRT